MPETPRLEEIIEFAENPEPRCPCILLLDTSGSMQGDRIDALNAGLQIFRDALNQDELAKKRVEVAIITFHNEITVLQDFITADRWLPPVLIPGGLTYMGTAIHQALDLITQRKQQYRENGISYYRPWIFMITDGEPQGESSETVTLATQRIHSEEAKKAIAFFAVGVEKANMTKLSEIVVRTPLKLKALNFQEMFIWLSTSLQNVSRSHVGEQVPLQPPSGWMEV